MLGLADGERPGTGADGRVSQTWTKTLAHEPHWANLTIAVNSRWARGRRGRFQPVSFQSCKFASINCELSRNCQGFAARIENLARGRNEALVLDPRGREILRYCKLHPFSFGGEDKYFARGDETCSFTCGSFQIAPHALLKKVGRRDADSCLRYE